MSLTPLLHWAPHMGPDRIIMLLGLFLVRFFFIFFVCPVWRGLHVSFLLYVKYSISYHIVSHPNYFKPRVNCYSTSNISETVQDRNVVTIHTPDSNL